MTTKVPYSLIVGAEHNLLDFGAAMDGTTNDDAAWTAVLTVIENNNGGTIVVPFGQTLVESTIELTSHTKIKGLGVMFNPRIIFKDFTNGQFGIRSKSTTARTDYCQIEDIDLKGSGTTTSQTVDAIYMRACLHWELKRVRTSSFGGIGLHMFGEFDSTGAVQNGGETARCSFYHCQFFATEFGVRITGTDNSGEAVGRIGSGTCSNNKFIACRFNASTNDGVLIEFGTRNVFIACDSQSNGRDGFRFAWFNNDCLSCHAENNGGIGYNFLNNSETEGNKAISCTGASSNVSGDYSDLSNKNAFWLSGGAGQSGLKLGQVDTDNVSDGAIWIDSDGDLVFKDSASNDITLNGGSCSFLAFLSSTASNETGNGTVAKVDFDSERFDVGGNFNTSNATFTAPKTGKYLFCVNVTASGITAAADQLEVSLVTSNETYIYRHFSTNAMPSQLTSSFTYVADMDVNDTATVTIEVNGEASDVVDIVGSASMLTSFSGQLIS